MTLPRLCIRHWKSVKQDNNDGSLMEWQAKQMNIYLSITHILPRCDVSTMVVTTALAGITSGLLVLLVLKRGNCKPE